MRLEFLCIVVNSLAIVLLDLMLLFHFSISIAFWIILSVFLTIAIMNVQLFNLAYELENVNKWNTSQIMISYSAKLRQVLNNVDNDYYYHTLMLGYIEIHFQKCDNEKCPLKKPGEDTAARKTKME